MVQTTIRPATPADAAGIARVHVASWRTTYRGILPEAMLAELSEERRAAFWGEVLVRPPAAGLVLVAEHPAEGVVGFADAGPPHEPLAGYDAELRAIYLLEAHQRGGLGRAMARAAAAGLLARGHRSLFLWVFAENASRHFYEALGGQVIAEGQGEYGGALKAKLAYGWPDLAALAAG
jgi:L-amino acid N-acyltransferase YncA